MAKNIKRQQSDIKQPLIKPKFHVVPGSWWAKHKIVEKGFDDSEENEIWTESDRIKKVREYGGVFVNDAFIELWNVTQGLLFLEGSYGSSKTTYAITRLLVKCQENKQFKCFYGRNKKVNARELHDNIIREIKRNGWESDFQYSEQPNGTTEIYHPATGNMFKLFGCDDDDSLKGIDNPTDIFIDEVNQISFESFGMLISRLRTPGVRLQLTACFNPCDVMPDHWLAKYIYSSSDGDSNSDRSIIKSLKMLNCVKHHSTYLMNYFQNAKNYFHTLVLKAGGDEERAKDYAEGRWGTKLNAKPYYKQFKAEKHVFDQEDLKYDPSLPIIFSFDENTQPYLPALIIQEHLVYEKDLNNKDKVIREFWFIDYIAAENPDNTLYSICPMIEDRYPNHKSGMYICGDATSKKESASLEKGQDFFVIAAGLLKVYDPELRISDANPNNKVRGNFLNMILKEEIYGIRIKISSKCDKVIEDFQNTMEDISTQGARTGKKDKSTSIVNGVRQVQRYGHLCDAGDYAICELCSEEYEMFQNDSQNNDASGGKRQIRNKQMSDKINESYPYRKDLKRTEQIANNPSGVVRKKSKNRAW